jgi:hypothetical protein
LIAYYETACALAARQNLDDADRALSYLEMAATNEEYRVWARTDPSFGWIRNEPLMQLAGKVTFLIPARLEIASRFRKIVCDPVPPFMDLEPIADHKKGLLAIGITGSKDLRRHSAWWLARQLSVSRGISRHWRDLANLANVKAFDGVETGTIESVGWLHLLFDAGVSSPTALRRRLHVEADRVRLQKAVADAAVAYDVVPPQLSHTRP